MKAAPPMRSAGAYSLQMTQRESPVRGADKLRDEESNRRIQVVKPKKLTATMKRRALKLRTTTAERGFLTRFQVKHEAITT